MTLAVAIVAAALAVIASERASSNPDAPRARWGALPMDSGRRCAHDRAVTRLLILLTAPAQLSSAAVQAWLQAELRWVTALADVERAELSRVRPGSVRCARTWDWLLELELKEDVAPAGWADTGVCGEWLADLRSLGLSPAVLLIDGATVLASKPGT